MTSGRSTRARLLRVGLLLGVLAAVLAPPVLAEDEWTDARPDDLSRYGLHRIVLVGFVIRLSVRKGLIVKPIS